MTEKAPEFSRADKALLVEQWPRHRSRSPLDVAARERILADFEARGFASHRVYHCLVELGLSKQGERSKKSAGTEDLERAVVDLSDMVNLVVEELDKRTVALNARIDELTNELAAVKRERSAPAADPIAAFRAKLGR